MSPLQALTQKKKKKNDNGLRTTVCMLDMSLSCTTVSILLEWIYVAFYVEYFFFWVVIIVDNLIVRGGEI